jgi:hypothetical protein
LSEADFRSTLKEKKMKVKIKMKIKNCRKKMLCLAINSSTRMNKEYLKYIT